ncbi:AfsA-related hotdog domain-containing protein [Streptomyces sp. Wb2n-11]|uniref:AfsA-related hotdog domain-containing protein n=1 Tax=Streptomyces sp. Wb2n-11 TaxID=1030533 RepID=UPI000A814294|nr:AfsA-related hotdog domain-containing protein [Streptomyces sp. Wb2n-11]
MTTQTAPEIPSAPVELSYGRTVDRSLVHRAAVSEVFVTDILPLAFKKVRAAVQLPLIHGYYSDHLQRPALYDALLLLESGRQAAIAGSHTHIGLSEGTTMIVDSFRLSLSGLKELLIGPEPGRLRIDTDYIGRPTRRGRYRKGKVAQRFYIGDAEVGEHEMDVLFINQHENEVLRHAQRGTPAPLTSDFPDQGPGADGSRQVEPARVGRGNPLNVVLSHAESSPAEVAAQVTPWFTNRGLFDHVYDHLPAMTLVEAARQLSFLAVDESLSTYAVGFEARFSRFAELDETVRASAPRPCLDGGRGEVPVRFLQGDAEIARVTVTLASGSEL